MIVIHETGETLIGDITPFDGITPDNNLEIISGFLINNDIKVNWNGLFAMKNDNDEYVPRFPLLENVTDSFSHYNKDDIGFIGDPGIGMEYLNSYVNLVYAFNLLNTNEPIDYSIIHNLNINRKSIICSESSLDVYKKCNNEQLISYIKTYDSIPEIKSLDYAFKKLILEVDDPN
jgi:hypothetical protein